MRLFIGIESCSMHRYSQQAVRETWLQNCLVDYKFFLSSPEAGPRPTPVEDEILFPVKDGWNQMLRKFCLEIDWVLARDYDYFFRCHTDTYVHVPRLLASGFEQNDYIGWGQETALFPFCYGGAGFWLSKKAMLFLQETLRKDYWVQKMSNSTEDYDIGRILHDGGFARTHDSRYREHAPGPAPDNDYITLHESEIEIKNGHNLRYRDHMLAAHRTAQ
jgi:hypothetical protein